MSDNKLTSAIVGGGCFWCTEAIFQEVKGVHKVISGYTGGNAPGKPTYREVCSGLTGHAEVVKIVYDPAVLSYEDLLIIFMTTHDPTTLNRQGGDVGTQYRSVIFYDGDDQKKIAEAVLAAMAEVYDDPVVTELSPIGEFHDAEDYHQDYYNNNQQQGYCNMVISPKLAKFRKMHADKLNTSATA